MHEIEHVCLCCGAEKFNFYVPVQPAFFCFVLCSILRMQCTWILAHLYLCNWKAVLINFKLLGLHTVQQLCKCATILKIYIFYFYVRLTPLLLDFVIIISDFVCAYIMLNSSARCHCTQSSFSIATKWNCTQLRGWSKYILKFMLIKAYAFITHIARFVRTFGNTLHAWNDTNARCRYFKLIGYIPRNNVVSALQL